MTAMDSLRDSTMGLEGFNGLGRNSTTSKVVFIFLKKPLLASYVCAVQMREDVCPLQSVCFREDISLKKPAPFLLHFSVVFLSRSQPTTAAFVHHLDHCDWKIKRVLNVGSEKRLEEAVSEFRQFALKIMNEKKQEVDDTSSIKTVDLLSRFVSSGHTDENFITDIVISYIFARRDTASAVLTWFLWLLSKNPAVECEIVKEINGKLAADGSVYDEVKEMVYTHASLCESISFTRRFPWMERR
ncbi:hypothetical protein R6Q57_002634 [Mikania cordata]